MALGLANMLAQTSCALDPVMVRNAEQLSRLVFMLEIFYLDSHHDVVPKCDLSHDLFTMFGRNILADYASRTGNETTGSDMSMSESGSGSVASEEEEELDDTSLGIKAKARSPRLSPRRKYPTAAAAATANSPTRLKNKESGRGGHEGGATAVRVSAVRGTRMKSGSSAPSDSSSDLSGSDSCSLQGLSRNESKIMEPDRPLRNGEIKIGGAITPPEGEGPQVPIRPGTDRRESNKHTEERAGGLVKVGIAERNRQGRVESLEGDLSVQQKEEPSAKPQEVCLFVVTTVKHKEAYAGVFVKRFRRQCLTTAVFRLSYSFHMFYMQRQICLGPCLSSL